MQLLLTTPGINAETGEYSDFGVRRRFWRTICVRTALCRRSASQLHSVLINSGGKPREAGTTVAMLAQFEQHIEDDSPLAEGCRAFITNIRCAIATTPCASVSGDARSVCQFRRQRPTKSEFRQQSFPSVVMNPQDAHSALFAVKWSWCGFVMPKGELRQRGVALSTWRALRGTRGSLGWAVQRYFLALEEGVNLLPGFCRSCKVFIAKPMRMA